MISGTSFKSDAADFLSFMLKVKATEYLLDGFPGWAKFSFMDVHGNEHQFIEKLPVLGLDYPEDQTQVPFEFDIPTLEEEILSNGIVLVRFLWDMEGEEGNKLFEVQASALH